MMLWLVIATTACAAFFVFSDLATKSIAARTKSAPPPPSAAAPAPTAAAATP